jgi:hypothetical protein
MLIGSIIYADMLLGYLNKPVLASQARNSKTTKTVGKEYKGRALN